ncbi:putative ABC transport system ATP-binding protein [Allocatelliglobosispora scoriae]|uniref:Putative ABC transport system ATP-binding protein n=1 Tax=Allocatelliglobosispora scoriae TaxID=643052 RepID=A0A841BL90_9ACTN|nr:ATP-binding cassette domain-containing protein [Allocatelliglobosispora scoriae]MBB5867512.1 putative ABC transport system ATP-binding protein [Allocatelliglobosispora scoriae]
MTANPVGTATLFAAARASCWFGPVRAVHEATCAIRAGQHIAVTGPSGSGKSTLLHLVAGLQAPNSGSVTWPDLGGDPRRDRTLAAIVFQAPSLLDSLDVVQNVQLPLLLAGTAPDDARASALGALDKLGLAGLAARMPAELSGGQAQRVATARALAMRPRLILADEPTGQLDHDTAEQVVTALIGAATSTGAALLVATHDKEIAARLAIRWRMRDGVLRTRPRHLDTGEDE